MEETGLVVMRRWTGVGRLEEIGSDSKMEAEKQAGVDGIIVILVTDRVASPT